MGPAKYLTQVKFQSKKPGQNSKPRRNIIYFLPTGKVLVGLVPKSGESPGGPATASRQNTVTATVQGQAASDISTLIAERFRRGRYLQSHCQKLPSIFSNDLCNISLEILFTLTDQNLPAI